MTFKPNTQKLAIATSAGSYLLGPAALLLLCGF
jgi:hypothetical protein